MFYEDSMNFDEVKRNAVAMPLASPAFAPGPCRFKNREFLIWRNLAYPASTQTNPKAFP